MPPNNSCYLCTAPNPSWHGPNNFWPRDFSVTDPGISSGQFYEAIIAGQVEILAKNWTSQEEKLAWQAPLLCCASALGSALLVNERARAKLLWSTKNSSLTASVCRNDLWRTRAHPAWSVDTDARLASSVVKIWTWPSPAMADAAATTGVSLQH